MIVLPKRGNHNTIFMKGKGLCSSKDRDRDIRVAPVVVARRDEDGDEDERYIDPYEILEENLFMIENIETKLDNLNERRIKLTNELRSDRNADQRFNLGRNKELRKYKEIIKEKAYKRKRLEKENKDYEIAIKEGRMIPAQKYIAPISDIDSDEEYMED